MVNMSPIRSHFISTQEIVIQIEGVGEVQAIHLTPIQTRQPENRERKLET